MSKKSPSDFLKSVLGRPVIVKLNSGTTYHGILACLDGYMNIAMEQTQEFVNGQLKNTYADTFIRGNNGKCDPSINFKKIQIVLRMMTRIRLILKLNMMCI
jgi:U6 snRNA-associated Sm-like protein LSm6